MTIRLGPLIVDAADPPALAAFWAAVLGDDARRRLIFRPQRRPKTVKNRVHMDLYVSDIAPLVGLGAQVLAEHATWMTLADIEGNEFCVFPSPGDAGATRIFAVCTDSERPEELAAWWAHRVAAEVRDGPDGTPRWLYGSAGWEDLIWKFVRVPDERVVPNRWQWTVDSEPGGHVDPQGNEFSVLRRARPAG